MQIDITDLRSTIVPKSDQLNAEQLLGGPMTITVTDVKVGSGDDQPVIVHYENDGGRPYKPCKTMRKVLILAWGHDARHWVGRGMVLFNDPAVKFGGMDVGGIRISHLSDIERDIKVSLTATKGKKAPHVIGLLKREHVDASAKIAKADSVDAVKAAFGAAYKATRDPTQRTRLKAVYDARMAELTATSLAALMSNIECATSAEAAALVLDAARDVLSEAEHADLAQHFAARWEAHDLPPTGEPHRRDG